MPLLTHEAIASIETPPPCTHARKLLGKEDRVMRCLTTPFPHLPHTRTPHPRPIILHQQPGNIPPSLPASLAALNGPLELTRKHGCSERAPANMAALNGHPQTWLP